MGRFSKFSLAAAAASALRILSVMKSNHAVTPKGLERVPVGGGHLVSSRNCCCESVCEAICGAPQTLPHLAFRCHDSSFDYPNPKRSQAADRGMEGSHCHSKKAPKWEKKQPHMM